MPIMPIMPLMPLMRPSHRIPELSTFKAQAFPGRDLDSTLMIYL